MRERGSHLQLPNASICWYQQPISKCVVVQLTCTAKKAPPESPETVSSESTALAPTLAKEEVPREMTSLAGINEEA